MVVPSGTVLLKKCGVREVLPASLPFDKNYVTWINPKSITFSFVPNRNSLLRELRVYKTARGRGNANYNHWLCSRNQKKKKAGEKIKVTILICKSARVYYQRESGRESEEEIRSKQKTLVISLTFVIRPTLQEMEVIRTWERINPGLAALDFSTLAEFKLQ